MDDTDLGADAVGAEHSGVWTLLWTSVCSHIVNFDFLSSKWKSNSNSLCVIKTLHHGGATFQTIWSHYEGKLSMIFYWWWQLQCPDPCSKQSFIFLWCLVTQGVRWTPSKVIHRLGKEINNPESVYYWAYKVSPGAYRLCVLGTAAEMVKTLLDIKLTSF